MSGIAEREGLSLKVLVGLRLLPRGPAYTLIRLLQGMVGHGLDVEVFAPADSWRTTGLPTFTGGIGNPLVDANLPHRYLGRELARRSEERLLKSLGRCGRREIVYTWGEVSIEVSRTLHALGVPVVREKFNCAKQTAKEILDRAYASFGYTENNSINDEMVEKENEELALAEAVFCPSPMVTESLLTLGLPSERLLASSYGWEPARFEGSDKSLAPVEGPTLVFAGLICVRKGAHILLEAWRRAGIRGRLVLVGEMEPLIAYHYRDVLARDDVVHLPYTENIAALYRSADWFAFPTLEEGGPQVTYEAAGCGVPGLVSRMGAGAFTKDGVNGLIVDSENWRPWAAMISTLPDRAQQRLELAEAARADADRFTYDKVGARRRDQLLQHFAVAERRQVPASPTAVGSL